MLIYKISRERVDNMGFFTRDFSKAGPGVPKDEPRKKGVARFFEIIIREHRDLMKINLLFTLVVLPSMVLFILGLLNVFPLGLGFSIVASYPIGGAMAASFFCITRMLRDDPAFVWDDWKRKFSENLKQAGISGVLCATFLYTQFFMFWLPLMLDGIMSGELEGNAEPLLMDPTWLLVGLILLILFNMVTPYVFLHFAYIKLGAYTIVKNSFIMAFSSFGRSFLGALSGLMLWIAFFMFFQIVFVLTPLIPLFFFVISWLLTLMWVWPVFDKRFSIEETLVKEQREELKDIESKL